MQQRGIAFRDGLKKFHDRSDISAYEMKYGYRHEEFQSDSQTQRISGKNCELLYTNIIWLECLSDTHAYLQNITMAIKYSVLPKHALAVSVHVMQLEFKQCHLIQH